MYIAALVIPVPENRYDDYLAWAKRGAEIFKSYGCLEVIECWEDFVPTGEKTDFFRAVDARPGEKIVVSWQVWPDKDSFFASETKMHEDNALDYDGEPPFDASRLVFGCFEQIHELSADG